MGLSVDLIEGLIMGAVSGLAFWLWFVHQKIVEIQIDLAKNYHSKEELRLTMQEALFPVKEELARLSRVLERRESRE